MKKQVTLRLMVLTLIVISAFQLKEDPISAYCTDPGDTVSVVNTAESGHTGISKVDFWKIDDEF